MNVSVYICLALNKLFPKKAIPGRESPQSYSEVEYGWAKISLAFYHGNIDLSGKTVLDAGCGLGGKTVYYAEQGCLRAAGIDRDEKYIQYASEFAKLKKVNNVDFTIGSLDRLPFVDNTFDIIFLNDVVEHIQKSLLLRSLQECQRVVKQGGSVCIEFPPWTSHAAAHLYDYIRIPWCQLMFSDETLIAAVESMKPKPGCELLSYVDHFKELNQITIPQFEELVNRVGFKKKFYELRAIRNLRFLSIIPFVNRLFVSRVITMLAK